MIEPVQTTSFQHLMLDEVGSTNDEARRQALSGAAADCFVVSARRQTQGRGRRGRHWQSPDGNLHLSLLLDVRGQLPQAAQLGFAAAIALVDALHSLLPGLAVQCKWPNDILVNGKKCAGMLLEPVGQDWLILGIGVDIVPIPDPSQMVYPVTCLQDHGFTGCAMDVLHRFMEFFQPLLSEWRRKGFCALQDKWLHRAKGIGQPVVVRLEHETLCGQFLGLDGDGALLLSQPGDVVRSIHAGDVFFPSAQ